MPKGPAGGPRPLAESRLTYRLVFEGPTELEADPPLATDVFDVRVRTPQDDVFEFFLDQVGRVLLAVNHLGGSSRHQILEFNIQDQLNGTTEWEAVFFLKGVGIGEFGRTVTSMSAMNNAYAVLIEGNDEPISRSQKITEFDSGPFIIDTIQIKAD